MWRGKPLVVHAVEVARASGANEVTVVVGPAREAVEREVSGAERLTREEAARASRSLARGVEAER